MSRPAPGRYRHYRGGEYELIAVAEHTETGSVLVVYQSCETRLVWAHPIAAFTGRVVYGGRMVDRYRHIR